MTKHPDWMYELYSTSLQKRHEAPPEWEAKPVAEKNIVPLNFSWKDEPYLWFLEQKGLL